MLRELAESCGISTRHTDGLGRDVQASDAAMLSVLRALGVSIESADQAESVLEARRHRPPPLAPPCVAGEEGEAVALPLHAEASLEYRATLTLENGEERTLDGLVGELPSGELGLGALPVGYHEVLVQVGSNEVRCHLLIAPSERYGAAGDVKRLGLFAPLYAIRGQDDYGVGDFTDLRRLMNWAEEQGIDFLGTLPLSAGNYEEEFQTSPYSPVSRLFWNEIYLDVEALAKDFPSQHLSELREHSRFVSERARLSELELVDYKKTSELKTRLLYRMAETAWELTPEVFAELLKAKPELHRYAQFRAVMTASGTTYHQWPGEQKLGNLELATYDVEDYRYHVFVQWAAEQQLAVLGQGRCSLYLDLSVGAGGSSYDVWRHQASFAKGVDVGAPPDDLFAGGQNWALPPLHPERSRENGHAYFLECVRANMRHAGFLRIDHVMGLHRLYWVPSDLGATEGLYVHYPADELYAILRIEAQRNCCVLVGEDLGTVPGSVRPAMESAGMHGLFVGMFQVEDNHGDWAELRVPAHNAFASLNTHDTPTFAGWFEQTDLTCDPMHLMKAWTETLAQGPAAAVVVTLEDLWLEPRPQNQPGTGPEVANWRRRSQQTLTQIVEGDEPGAWLRHLHSLRSP